MGSRLVMGVLALCACNARLGSTNGGGPDSSSPHADAARQIDSSGNNIDAALGAWGTPAVIQGVDVAGVNQDDCTLNSTMTELYFKKPSAAGTDQDLYWMTRATVNDPWSAPQLLSQLDTTLNEESPRLSPDDTHLYFGRSGDIFVAARAQNGDPWGSPSPLAEVNTAAYEKWLAICDGNYFMVSRGVTRADMTTDQDLFLGHMDGTDPGTVSNDLSATGFSEISSFLSKNCMTAYFASNRSGQTMIYTATRNDPTQPFGQPAMYEYFGTATDDEDPWESYDQHTFVFASVRDASTTKMIYESTR